jgi:hypothetical protein
VITKAESTGRRTLREATASPCPTPHMLGELREAERSLHANGDATVARALERSAAARGAMASGWRWREEADGHVILLRRGFMHGHGKSGHQSAAIPHQLSNLD